MAAKKTIGELVKDARIASELGQAEAAKKAGVNQSYWSRVEAGEREPTVKSLRRMAAVLGVTVHDLIPLEDECE